MTCVDCGCEITGSPGKRRCTPCRDIHKKRHNKMMNQLARQSKCGKLANTEYEMSFQEIAAESNVTRQSVEHTEKRGFLRFKRHWEELYGEAPF